MEINNFGRKNYWPKLHCLLLNFFFFVKDQWIILLSGAEVREGVGQLINKSKHNT